MIGKSQRDDYLDLTDYRRTSEVVLNNRSTYGLIPLLIVIVWVLLQFCKIGNSHSRCRSVFLLLFSRYRLGG
jgi:hypothetical protein